MEFIKRKWYVFILSIVLVFLMLVISPLITYILMEVTENKVLSYIISCIVCGFIASLPIVLALSKTKTVSTAVKIIISLLLICFLGIILLYG